MEECYHFQYLWNAEKIFFLGMPVNILENTIGIFHNLNIQKPKDTTERLCLPELLKFTND